MKHMKCEQCVQTYQLQHFFVCCISLVDVDYQVAYANLQQQCYMLLAAGTSIPSYDIKVFNPIISL